MSITATTVKRAAFALAFCLLASCAATIAADQAPKPHMLYFYNPSCRLCTKTNEVVADVEKKYENNMGHQRFNIADTEHGTDNVLYMFDLMDQLEVPEEGNVTLVVFLGNISVVDNEAVFEPARVLIEGDEIIEKLDREVADFLDSEKKAVALGLPRPAPFFSHNSASALASMPVFPAEPTVAEANGETAPAATPRPRSRADREAAVSRRAQAQLQFGAISAAAIADSVNPCAFATIIILVAMMSSAKRTRKEIVAVCLAFTFSVFLTYFAIGLFLYKVISMINEQGGWFLVAADIIYYIAFAICVVFGLLSLRDAYFLFSGKAAEEMTLKLPKAFKKRINIAMAKGVRAQWLVVGVFIAGVTVSFLEAACTGQVYLPTIISLAKINFWHSIGLLLWYNFLFIVPLLIIFGLVLLGVTSAQLADFFKKNVAWIRLALGLVFIAMGAVIWFEMYWPPGYRG